MYINKKSLEVGALCWYLVVLLMSVKAHVTAIPKQEMTLDHGIAHQLV